MPPIATETPRHGRGSPRIGKYGKREKGRITQRPSAAPDAADNREELRASTKLTCGECEWSFAGAGQNDEPQMITI